MKIKYILKNKRILISGSANDGVSPHILIYTHNLIKEIVHQTLDLGGGIVTSVGDDPKTDGIPKVFFWSVIEAIVEYARNNNIKWNSQQDKPIIIVAYFKYDSKIPNDRRALWNEFQDLKQHGLVRLHSYLSFGGNLRQLQEQYSDLLMTFGGYKGVVHLSNLFQISSKPVIPINLPLGNKATSNLFESVLENPIKYLSSDNPETIIASFERLNLLEIQPDRTLILRYIFDLIHELNSPKAFCVRLMNPDDDNFQNVESFFRKVIDNVIGAIGYQRHEVSSDPATQQLMNVEIFQELHKSQLTIIDLTSLRPNCLIELGYALGNGQRILLTTQKGTKLPFDIDKIPCFFWDSKMDAKETRKKLRKFIKINWSRDFSPLGLER